MRTLIDETAYANGYKFFFNNCFFKTLKEARQRKNDIIPSGYELRVSTNDWSIYSIKPDYSHLLRLTKDELKTIIIVCAPHLKGSLYKCQKRDLIGEIKNGKMLTIQSYRIRHGLSSHTKSFKED